MNKKQSFFYTFLLSLALINVNALAMENKPGGEQPPSRESLVDRIFDGVMNLFDSQLRADADAAASLDRALGPQARSTASTVQHEAQASAPAAPPAAASTANDDEEQEMLKAADQLIAELTTARTEAAPADPEAAADKIARAVIENAARQMRAGKSFGEIMGSVREQLAQEAEPQISADSAAAAASATDRARPASAPAAPVSAVVVSLTPTGTPPEEESGASSESLSASPVPEDVVEANVVAVGASSEAASASPATASAHATDAGNSDRVITPPSDDEEAASGEENLDTDSESADGEAKEPADNAASTAAKFAAPAPVSPRAVAMDDAVREATTRRATAGREAPAGAAAAIGAQARTGGLDIDTAVSAAAAGRAAAAAAARTDNAPAAVAEDAGAAPAVRGPAAVRGAYAGAFGQDVANEILGAPAAATAPIVAPAPAAPAAAAGDDYHGCCALPLSLIFGISNRAHDMNSIWFTAGVTAAYELLRIQKLLHKLPLPQTIKERLASSLRGGLYASMVNAARGCFWKPYNGWKIIGSYMLIDLLSRYGWDAVKSLISKPAEDTHDNEELEESHYSTKQAYQKAIVGWKIKTILAHLIVYALDPARAVKI